MSDQAARIDPPQSVREKRMAPRIAVALPALLGTWEGQHRARIHNLSRGGALVEASIPLRAGNQVQFHCGTIEARGTVVWQDSNCYGISFRSPIDEVSLAQQVARSEAVSKHRENRARAIAEA